MSTNTKKTEHEYIRNRLDRYYESYHSKDVDGIMAWMEKDGFVHSDFAAAKEGHAHTDMRKLFERTFSNFHDLKVTTISLHGDKHFTTQEWVITAKAALGPNGERLPKEKAKRQKLRGCTLMWWNDDDKIIKHHDYVVQRDPDYKELDLA